MKQLSLGFSPCPNDTFIFYGLVHERTKVDQVFFLPPVLEDVEELNRRGLQGELDVTKLSFHAFGHMLDEYCLLSAGSALGRGCGPLLVAKDSKAIAKKSALRIAIPGQYTTAALLLQMYLDRPCNLVEMRFDQIMQNVQNNTVDAGVIIHESRFTYQDLGLHCIQDLGQWWEDSTSMPIPLGCIAAKRSLGKEMLGAIDSAIQKSVQYSFANPGESLPYIRKFSQEMEPEVVQSHIGLYVNDFSVDLGTEGVAAVDLFLQKGREVGALPDSEKMIGY